MNHFTIKSSFNVYSNLLPTYHLNTVSQDNNNSEKQVQNEVFFDYQTITPHEIKVLDLMGESSWTFMGFRNYLLEQGNSFNSFKSEGQFENFVKIRPKLFRWTETYVWRRVDLKPLEKQILDLMGDSMFEIETLTRVLQKNKIGPFNMSVSLTNFLGRRPELFSISDNFVWSCKVSPENKRNKEENIEIQSFKETGSKESINEEKIVQKDEFDYLTLTPHEIRIIDLMGELSWMVSEFRNKLFEQGFSSSNQKSDKLLNFFENRPKIFCLTKIFELTYVWSLVDLKPLEKQVLEFMGEKVWRIEELGILIEENKIARSNLKGFIHRRPELFGMTDTHVWSLEKSRNQIENGSRNDTIEIGQTEKSDELAEMKKIKIKKKKSELHFLEKQILELIGDSTCRIIDLETKLIDEGINTFKPKGASFVYSWFIKQLFHFNQI